MTWRSFQFPNPDFVRNSLLYRVDFFGTDRDSQELLKKRKKKWTALAGWQREGAEETSLASASEQESDDLKRQLHTTLTERSGDVGRVPPNFVEMLDLEGRDVMETPKESKQKGGEETPVLASSLQQQRPAAAGSQSPRPSDRPESLNLLRGQSTKRSCDWVRRHSAKGAPEMSPSRLSMSWSSTRRKGLKELLLQSTQASPTWLTASCKASVPIDSQQVEDDFSEVASEELCLALEPLEHEWMLTVAQGDAESILDLLAKEPSLLSRRDFVTGFTVLHWLAKHGRHEALIQVMAFAERNGYPTNVDMPTASGRMTPLHLAALQGHVMTLKILVGAFGANTSLRDHNGRRAWQYLHASAPRELKELLGATEEDLAIPGAGNTNNNCAPSRWSWIGAFRTESHNAEAARPGQRASPTGSYLRNVFRQAVAFFQDR